MRSRTIYGRPRLDRLLGETLEVPLTAVVAGAGYGKTTAAREYLKKAGVPYAWVTLTDGDAGVFWDKLCDAVKPLSQKSYDAMYLLGLPVGAWPVSRAVKLIRERCAGPFILCIDDYQYLPEDSPIHQLVETVAFEDIPNFHILLLSRMQPNFRLATLASKGMALCVDADSLRFSSSETEGYLAMRGLRLTKSVIGQIQASSGGWISAIYLLGEGIRAGGEISHGRTIDTLFEENFMGSLSDIDREMLYRLSEFDSFPSDMAAHALGMERVRELLSLLLRENAFITLDEAGLYRFHPLFRSYLAKHRPNDEMQKQVCFRAGMWLVKHPERLCPYSVELFQKAGCVEEFLTYLNHPGAIRLNYYDLYAICRMAMTLPDEMCLKYPFPYLQINFYLLLSGDRRYIQLAERLLKLMREYFSANDYPDGKIILGELIVVSRTTGFGQIGGGEDPLVEAARLLGGRPSEILRPSDPFTFGLPMLLHSEYMRAGTLDETVARCQNNAYELVTDGLGRGSECLVRAEAALLRCEMDEAKRFALQALREAAEKEQYFIIASACFTLMRRALFLGDTEGAAENLGSIRELVPKAIMAGEPNRVVFITLREAIVLSECFFHIALRHKNDIPSDFLDGSHRRSMTDGLGIPQMCSAMALYITGCPAGALRLCERQGELPDVCQCARLTGYVLTALANNALYGADSGLPVLTQALLEAQTDGVVLPFAENPDILPLLRRMRRTDVDESFLERVRRCCEDYSNVAPKDTPGDAAPLSDREREVLRLTAAGKNRREAAGALAVQEETIKKHLSSAYKKLGAKNKTEAIRLAKTRGVI